MNKDLQRTEPFPDFNQTKYWEQIGYAKASYLKNINYDKLNEERANYRKAKIFKILDKLVCKSLSDENATFSDLYNLLQNEDLLYEAFGRIKNTKGPFTLGTETINIDIITSPTINSIIYKLKNNCYKFKPARRILIPKPGKVEKRPLGIPNIDDKILQQAIRMILESIYEPIFQKYNVRLGCHHAITHIKKLGQANNIAIEGDIKGAFDNVKFDKLINILSLLNLSITFQNQA